MPGASLGLAIPVDIPPFHFQPRRLSVDWRRFSAIDVERVAREVDVAALQEHLTSVTFCNLDGERCPHCRQPAYPILLKVLRMAQLSIEYLLHCQEHLGTSLAMHAQRLQAAHAELACTQQQVTEQVAQLQSAKEESRAWKKLIATQQLVLQAGPSAHCKCHLCDKAFMNYSFLQAHVQRRHAEATEAEQQKMKQVEQMEEEVEELKAKLQEMQQQLEAERGAEKLRREQEMERAHQQKEEGRRDLERWTEEEWTKLHEEMDGLRQLFLAAFKDMASRSSAMEGKLQELQDRETVESNLGTLQNEDPEEAQWWAPSWAELRDEQKRMAVQRAEQRQALKDLRRDNQEIPIKPLSASKSAVTGVVADEESSAPTSTPDREKAARGGKQRLLQALWRNPNLLKQFRPILEEVLEEKLESMGIERVVKGISTPTYKSLQALVRLQQQQKAEMFPGLLRLRRQLARTVMWKIRRQKKPSSTLPRQLSITPAQNQKSSRSLCGSQPMVIPAAEEPEALVIPQPAPRSKAHSPPSSLRTSWDTLRISKASRPHQGLVPQQSSEVMLGWKEPALSPGKLSSRQEAALAAVVPGYETDYDSSDLGSVEETAGSGTATSTTVRLLRRCPDAVAQRPPSEVKHFPALRSATPKTSQPTKKLQFAGDRSDLEISSLEDPAEPLGSGGSGGTTQVHRAARRPVVTGR